MRITGLRIVNYKSFDDSGWIKFSEGFNVVVGKNSSGKTALLEAFRVTRTPHRPHRFLTLRRDEPPNPRSTFDVEVAFSESELRDAYLRLGTTIDFPVTFPEGESQQLELGQKAVANFFESKQQSLRFRGSSDGLEPLQYPFHGLFRSLKQNLFMRIHPTPGSRSYRIDGPHGGKNDTVIQLVNEILPRKLYVFKAERLNIGEIGFAEEKLLSENASNLPRVLFSLSTNPSMFERYNRHVNQIFPYIKRVAVFPKGSNIDVRVWSVDPATERDDLAIPLQESGTGIGQALAILYVAMTIENGIIVIDEPNSFLHPGAAKTLVEILAQYNHQYIVSTHSTEILSKANPTSLIVVHWADGKSRIEPLDKSNVVEQRRILTELGVSPADVFGTDQIVWVEGATEAECFPILVQHALKTLPPGLAFVAVRSVDELIHKKGPEGAVFEVYERLSKATVGLPRALRFSFDREKRSQDYIDRTEAKTAGKIKFLPARCYESFLIHPKALSEILTEEARGLDANSVSEAQAVEWLMNNAAKHDAASKWRSSLDDVNWKASVDAALLLEDLFRSLAKIEYSKTKHSRMLTNWLLENEPKALEPLTNYVLALIDEKPRP